MDEKNIQELIEKKVAEAKLDIADKRFNYLSVLSGGLLAFFGIVIPIWQSNTSADKVDNAILTMNEQTKQLKELNDKYEQKMDLKLDNIQSKSESAFDETSNNLDKKFSEITAEIDLVIGKINKPADLEVKVGERKLNNYIFLYKLNQNEGWYSELPFITILNKGGKEVKNPVICVYTTHEFYDNHSGGYPEGTWQEGVSELKEYRYKYIFRYWKDALCDLYPGDAWSIKIPPMWSELNNTYWGKMKIYYDDKFFEADFKMGADLN